MARGRPTKFTKELGEKIIQYVIEGYTNEVAYAKAGVAPRTVYRWKNKADEHKTKTDLKCFFEELEVAEKLRQGEYEDVTRESALEHRNPVTAQWYLAHLDKTFVNRTVNETKLDAKVESEVTVNLLEKMKQKRGELNDLNSN